jgi:hypothetical protein
MVECISPWISYSVRSSLVVIEHFVEMNISPASESVSVREVQLSLLGQRKVT